MKFQAERIQQTMAIYAGGKADDVYIRFCHLQMDRYHTGYFNESFDVEEAEKMVELLQTAIEDAKRRKLLPDNDDD